VSFGLVSVPVVLVSANRAKPVSMHMVTEQGTQLARRYFSESGRKPLTDEDIVRGYEISKGKFVVVDDDDLERLAPESSRDIDLTVFVPVDDIDPIYFERAYYMVPGAGGSKPYRLLARVMEEMGRAGIATFVMRGKEYLVALIAENGILRAERLRFANELRTAEDVGLPKPAKVSATDTRRVVTQMKKLYKTKFDPEELTDDAAEELVKIAEQKRKAGEDVVKATVPDEEAAAPSGDVIDLMERLKRSLKAEGGAKKRAPGKRKRAS
jgi:DNA end-binding protein Ku